MQSATSEFAPTCVCIPSTSLTRYVLFETSMEGLHCPNESVSYRVVSSSAAKNRNDAIRLAPKECTHFFFMDDDHHFGDTLLLQLLRRRLQVVCGLTPIASPPFSPVLFNGIQIVKGKTKHRNIPWAELDGKSGLYPIFAGAGASLLVTRDVLDRVGDPWFELGKYDSEQAGEDLYFYEKCRNLGIPLYVDLDATMGHISPTAVWPVLRADGKWTVHLMWETGGVVTLPRSDDVQGSIGMHGKSSTPDPMARMPSLQEQAKDIVIK